MCVFWLNVGLIFTIDITGCVFNPSLFYLQPLPGDNQQPPLGDDRPPAHGDDLQPPPEENLEPPPGPGDKQSKRRQLKNGATMKILEVADETGELTVKVK